jgi:hypothetical protein
MRVLWQLPECKRKKCGSGCVVDSELIRSAERVRRKLNLTLFGVESGKWKFPGRRERRNSRENGARDIRHFNLRCARCGGGPIRADSARNLSLAKMTTDLEINSLRRCL